MAVDKVHQDYLEASSLAKYPFEPYWPQKKLRICVTGAGGFIASHLAKRLKSEGHYIIACDWKRNEHFSVSSRLHGPCVLLPSESCLTTPLHAYGATGGGVLRRVPPGGPAPV
jgi:hypothetical protein